MKVKIAQISDLDALSLLFDGYRVFYKQASDVEAAKRFLKSRFELDDSVVFIAYSKNGKGLGFTQLYPSFSSVSMQRTYILNDLFVAEAARGQGIGEALMEAAKKFAIAKKSKGLTLETGIDNPAQKLYVRLGWKKDTAVDHYTWEI